MNTEIHHVNDFERKFNTRLAVGRMAYDGGYYSQAARHFQLALNSAEDNNLALELKAQALVALAKATAALGNFNKAKDCLEKALAIDESDNISYVEEAEDYHQLSLLYWRSGKTDLAFELATKSWTLANADPNTPDELKAKLLKHFAVLSEQTGKLTDCENYLNLALEFIEDSPELGKFSAIYGDVLLVKVLLLAEQNRLEEAAELYPHASQIAQISRGITHPRVKEVLSLFGDFTNKVGHESNSEIKLELENAQKKSKHGII